MCPPAETNSLTETPSALWPVHSSFPAGSLPRVVDGLRPGVIPWSKLAPADSRETKANKRPSAVMMLFIPPSSPAAPAELVFTRRSVQLRSHRGQISFAGGRCDPQDSSPAATAVRELQEELGVDPALVQVAGMLPPVQALDLQLVFPIVGIASVQMQDLVLAAAEVEAVFSVPWPALGQGQGRGFSFNIFGNWRLAHSYLVPGGNIWGPDCANSA